MIKDIVRFSFPTEIAFGPGAVERLPENMEEAGINKPLIVTDPGLIKTEVFHKVQGVLQTADVAYGVFGEVHPNPSEEDISKALDFYHAEGADGVIGLGGGSALDAAKVVRVLAVNGGKVNDYNCATGGNQKIKGPLPPLLAIPTTSGTGSEVGRCAVITSVASGRKFMVCHPLMMPTLALLDPELTVGLPAFLTAATGMDALAHCVESLAAPVFHPMCDAIAIKGIEFVAQYLKKAVKTPTDIESRAYMQLASMMGAVAFQKDLGAAHALSHALSAVCHVQHGLANAICLVPVMKFNREIAATDYATVATSFGINTFGMSDLEAADKAIEAVANLTKAIGIPATLSEVGVEESHLKELAQKAFLDSCHQTNPRPCTETDLLALYQEAL